MAARATASVHGPRVTGCRVGGQLQGSRGASVAQEAAVKPRAPVRAAGFRPRRSVLSLAGAAAPPAGASGPDARLGRHPARAACWAPATPTAGVGAPVALTALPQRRARFSAIRTSRVARRPYGPFFHLSTFSFLLPNVRSSLRIADTTPLSDTPSSKSGVCRFILSTGSLADPKF